MINTPVLKFKFGVIVVSYICSADVIKFIKAM